ncbi:uncharacterized protein FOMMEDRAFT_161133 [Fomitiporia mediterranea MF3/22]|uniref:uncharacterized protein n=1 Tax=Fomitiporia mediterranea (strain MF3/22) TaxID=694068 RepID=UPI0004407D9E|nr:uncharacterized protein FOMMEDRAFT_161133 [Fomitiporia mediterranea MF3/22]EJC98934.1 hypothetical protein FOMMEDRAFT_161133 [Fomitiporia mediterranea MF3/22]
MAHADDLMTFLLEFYNYALYVKNDKTLDDKDAKIEMLRDNVDKRYTRSLTTRTTNAKKRQRTSKTDQDGSNRSAGQGSVSHQRAVMTVALQKSGFKVQDDENSARFEPFIKVCVE